MVGLALVPLAHLFLDFGCFGPFLTLPLGFHVCVTDLGFFSHLTLSIFHSDSQ